MEVPMNVYQRCFEYGGYMVAVMCSVFCVLCSVLFKLIIVG
jgi:ABC-type sulfate transport system permease component